MIEPRRLWSVFLLALFLFVAPGARAEEYVAPSLSNFMKTLVRFGAIDLRRLDVLDAFARVTECQIYRDHYSDDFKWQEVRKALRKSIKQNIGTFPTTYRFDASLQLDRYDFKEGIYRFTDKTAQHSANTFSIRAQSQEQCGMTDADFPPLSYKFVLDQPVNLNGIPLSAEEGKLLLSRMVESGNKDRLVYARFNFRVVYVAPIVMDTPKTKAFGEDISEERRLGPMVTQSLMLQRVAMDSRLDSIEYFEDPERTKLIYTYRP